MITSLAWVGPSIGSSLLSSGGLGLSGGMTKGFGSNVGLGGGGGGGGYERDRNGDKGGGPALSAAPSTAISNALFFKNRFGNSFSPGGKLIVGTHRGRARFYDVSLPPGGLGADNKFGLEGEESGGGGRRFSRRRRRRRRQGDESDEEEEEESSEEGGEREGEREEKVKREGRIKRDGKVKREEEESNDAVDKAENGNDPLLLLRQSSSSTQTQSSSSITTTTGTTTSTSTSTTTSTTTTTTTTTPPPPHHHHHHPHHHRQRRRRHSLSSSTSSAAGQGRDGATPRLKVEYVAQVDVKDGHNAGKRINGIQVVPGRPDCVLITTADHRIRMYTTSTYAVVCKFKGHKNASAKIAASMSSDGRFVICGSDDGWVYIWDQSSLDPRRPLSSSSSSSSSAAAATTSASASYPNMALSQSAAAANLATVSALAAGRKAAALAAAQVGSGSNKVKNDRWDSFKSPEVIVTVALMAPPVARVGRPHKILGSGSGFGFGFGFGGVGPVSCLGLTGALFVVAGLSGSLYVYENF